MKAKLEFILPEEQTEFTTAVNAGNYVSALYTFITALDREYKEGDPKTWSTLEQVRNNFYSILDDFNIDLFR